jgi:hypothetical protein
MGSLQRFEQRLEHMVTGAFARTFRSAVQPVEIAAALRREVDNSAQILSRDRRLAPNDFTIDLSPSDFDRLSGFGETLSQELADMLHQHAADESYAFVGPVRLNFQRVDDLTTGRFRVSSQASAAVSQPPAAPQPASRSTQPPVILEINGGKHPIEPPGVVVGRGSAADLRIDDPGVSRRHAEFRVQHTPAGPQVTVTDLGSTNGTIVNGQRVSSTLVGDGASVLLGSTSIVVRLPRPPAAPGRPSAGYGQPPAWSR